MKVSLPLVFFLVVAASAAQAQKANPLLAPYDQAATATEQKMLTWRRDLHQHPELGNREFKTAKKIAEHLRSLGIVVQEGVAHTGVVGVLRGGQPGPVVALRADMDALPVTEAAGLPFASTAKGSFEGNEVGVMHACGHDTHVAMLMAVAEALVAVQDKMPGTVKFIFQPAEEGAPAGEEGGAELMIKQGVLDNPKVDAIFGVHVMAGAATGKIGYRYGPMMAAVDYLTIVVRGRQTHGAKPWGGIDPIVVSSQIVLGLQTIESRQLDVTLEPSIITIGSIHGGVRNNIIPDSVKMVGTLRNYNEAMREDMFTRIRRTAEKIAEASGATAEVRIRRQYPTTINNPQLMQQMLPTLQRMAGAERVFEAQKSTGAEDFSFFQKQVPGVFLFLGITPPDQLGQAASNHSPLFFVDEAGLLTGVRALGHLTLDYMHQAVSKK